MSDDDAALDSMDTEEEIFNRTLETNVRRSKSLRKLRSHSGSNSHITRNNLSVRRSTRNRMQTYDNLNTSWILGKINRFFFFFFLNKATKTYTSTHTHT